MMKPDSKNHRNLDPRYLSDLIASTGMTQSRLAEVLGVTERTIRYWAAGSRGYPYSVQFCLEVLVYEV